MIDKEFIRPRRAGITFCYRQKSNQKDDVVFIDKAYPLLYDKPKERENMNLYIKQKVFSFKDKFTVKDEYGQDKYIVEGEFFSLGKKLHVYDMAGNEVAFIQQKIMSFLPRYFVFVGDKQIAEIVKKFSFFTPRYEVLGLPFSVTS